MDMLTKQSEVPEEEGDESRDNLGVVLNRINRRQVAMGLSDRRASLKSGRSNDLIRSMRKQWRAGIQKYATHESLMLLAAALETTPEWLALGEGPEHVEPEKKKAARKAREQQDAASASAIAAGNLPLKITGSIASGVWVDKESAALANELSVSPDARYLHVPQQAYLVQDRSVDNVALPGTVIIVADIGTPRPGDHVIVRRRQPNEVSEEITVKKLARHGAQVQLCNDSTDPTLSGDIITMTEGAKQTDDGYGIVFGGILISVYRPL